MINKVNLNIIKILKILKIKKNSILTITLSYNHNADITNSGDRSVVHSCTYTCGQDVHDDVAAGCYAAHVLRARVIILQIASDRFDCFRQNARSVWYCMV